jgi:phosphopantetheinyl transferase
VAIGISDRPVGVDVEIIDARPSEPAWNILHARERAWLSDQGAEEQAENFLALWCAKEAYLKALGLGLRREPAKIAVSVVGEGQLSIEDSRGPVALENAFVTRRHAHGAPAVLACVVLAR